MPQLFTSSLCHRRTHWLQRGCLLVGISGFGPAALAQLAFAPPVAYSTGSQPQTVVVRDINLDGKPDLLTANISSNTISVLLGATPLGTFGPATDYSTGTSPFGLAVGDVNGDGRLDVVTTNMHSNTVSVLLGSATALGTFGPATDYATGFSPRTVALGDVNGDNRLDLVTANFAANSVSVLLGSASMPGSFSAPMDYAADTGTHGLALGDLNGDNRLDLVTANVTANSLTVLFNTTTAPGTFAPAVTYALSPGSTPVSVALGDVNSDGRLDVVSANAAGNTASVWLGSMLTAGALLSPTSYATGTNSSPYGVAVGDLTGDGRADIVTSNGGEESVSVLLGASTGAGAFSPYTAYSVGSRPVGVTLADLNGDGRLDVVTAHETSVHVLLNGGTALAAPAATPLQVLEVFPRPAHGSFTLAVPAFATTTSVQAELRNALGQVVHRATATLPPTGLPWQWETTGLAAGVYTLQVQVGTRMYTERVILY
jgi:hypothetical protein